MYREEFHGDRQNGPVSPTLIEARAGDPTINNANLLYSRPPWHVVSSRELAEALGVTLQTLANWRIRDSGPPPAPHRWFGGNRTYYRIDQTLAWLSALHDHPTPAWKYCRDHLAQIFDIEDLATESDVMRLVHLLENARAFPHRWPPRSLEYLQAPSSERPPRKAVGWFGSYIRGKAHLMR